MKKAGDGFGEFTGTFGIGRGQGEATSEAVARNAEFLEEVRAAAKRVFRKNRIAETGFDQALDGFGIVRFHHDVRRDADFLEIAIDDETHVAAFGVEKERNAGEFGGAERTDMAAADFVGGWAHDEELFVKKWNDFEVGFRDGKGDEGEIEAAVEEASDHFFGDADGDADFGVGILLAKFSEWAAELVDQSGNASGEMKRVDVLREVVDEGLLDVAHHRHDLFGEFGEAERGGSRDKAFAAADEEFGVQLVGEIVKLKTDGAGREMNFLGSASHAWRIHDGEEELELVNVHSGAFRGRG